MDESNTRLEKWRALEMLSIAKPIKIKVLLHQFSLLILNLPYIFLFTVFLPDRGIPGIREMPHYN